MSSAATPLKRPATEEDLLALPHDGPTFELIDGELVERAVTGLHSRGQFVLAAHLHGPYHHRGGPRGPGGWHFGTEPYVRLGTQVRRPDLAGWRREHLSRPPQKREIIAVRPDWVCEILSPGHESNDLVRKRRLYHQHEIPHYWILDPRDQSLMVLRWMAQGYLEVLVAGRDEVVRAEPFDQVELAVAELFEDEET